MVSLRFKLELYMFVIVLLPLVFVLVCDAAALVDMAEVAPGPTARARRTLGSEPGELESEVVVVAPSPGPLFPAHATSTRDVHSPQSSPAPVVQPGMCTYTIITKTGDKSGAGTDSNISLRLQNPANDYIFFDSLDTAYDNFETGSTDFFRSSGACVHQVCQMTLYTDYSGWFASWYPEFVEVYVSPEGASSLAYHQKWDILQWLPTDDEAEARFVLRDHCSN